MSVELVKKFYELVCVAKVMQVFQLSKGMPRRLFEEIVLREAERRGYF